MIISSLMYSFHSTFLGKFWSSSMPRKDCKKLVLDYINPSIPNRRFLSLSFSMAFGWILASFVGRFKRLFSQQASQPASPVFPRPQSVSQSVMDGWTFLFGHHSSIERKGKRRGERARCFPSSCYCLVRSGINRKIEANRFPLSSL